MILAVALAVLGVGAIAASELLARLLAPRYVLGRTLAAARDVTIDEAVTLALTGDDRYVRVHGRMTSDEEFPDEHDRPLVFRRKRIEVRAPDGRWREVLSEVEGVPFGVEARSSFIAVDSARLSHGLVVVPRIAVGVAADLPAGALLAEARVDDLDPAAEARLVVEQVSAVEHAYVAGVAGTTVDGQVRMSAGRRRPLILTTLEIDDAMRLLGAGQRRLVFALSGLFGLGIVLLVAAAAAAVLALI